MRSEIASDGQERSFIDRARRAQIIASAIDVIAERGFAGASLNEIARAAGISKGVISYHFAGKSELIQQTVGTVYGEAFNQIFEDMEREPTAAGKLRVYISANLEFMRQHHKRMRAMVEVFMNFRKEDGTLFYDISYNEDILQALSEICVQGQQAGEFRSFDPRVMAIAVQAALDSVLVMLHSSGTLALRKMEGAPEADSLVVMRVRPEVDLAAYARELIELFDRATRREAPGAAN